MASELKYYKHDYTFRKDDFFRSRVKGKRLEDYLSRISISINKISNPKAKDRVTKKLLFVVGFRYMILSVYDKFFSKKNDWYLTEDNHVIDYRGKSIIK